jgi:hypothetical protein
MTAIQTGDTNVDNLLTQLIESIETTDLDNCKKIFADLLVLCINNAPLAKWITIPANLMSLQELLSSTFDIDRRQFQLKTRVANRQRRAILFLKAISIALGKVEYNDDMVSKSNS